MAKTASKAGGAAKARDKAGAKGTIGIIGLGIMGGAIGRNLVAAGWTVIGYDIDTTAIAAATAAGIEVVASPAAVAEHASDIITSLPKPEAVIATAKAIAAASAKRRVVMEASTLALEDKQAFHDILTAKGHIPLDIPLSGTGSQAAVKDLVVYASGDSAEIKRLGPLFMDFGRKFYDLGAFGNGTKMKYVANHLVAIHNVASAEAMVLGMKAGLDPKTMVEVIGTGAGTSRIFELRAPMMAANHYLPATMRNSTWKKDMTVIGDFAMEIDCPVPLFTLTQSIYAAALNMGLGAQDTGAVCTVLEAMAGIKR
jgi:L-threonate 2-dehydrogenase